MQEPNDFFYCKYFALYLILFDQTKNNVYVRNYRPE